MKLQLGKSEIITGSETVLNSPLGRHLPVFSGDLQLDLRLGIGQRNQGQPAFFTSETPLGPLHAGLEKPAGIHLEGIVECPFANELRLALPGFTEASPGAFQLPIAFGFEDNLRARDNLHLSGRISDLPLAELCVFRRQDPQNRGDNPGTVVNLDLDRPAAVVASEKIKFERVKYAGNTVAQRRCPEFFSGNGASLLNH